MWLDSLGKESMVKMTETSWHEQFDATLPQMPLLDIVRLSACSKTVHTFVVKRIAADCSLAGRLLHEAVLDAAAAAAADRLLLQHTTAYARSEAILWLLKVADIPRALACADSSKFVLIPNVPISTCQYMVDAGMRISKEQLVSAACTGVEGVQNWVLAHRYCHVSTGLPVLYEAVCCGDSLEVRVVQLRQYILLLWPSEQPLAFAQLVLIRTAQASSCLGSPADVIMFHVLQSLPL